MEYNIYREEGGGGEEVRRFSEETDFHEGKESEEGFSMSEFSREKIFRVEGIGYTFCIQLGCGSPATVTGVDWFSYDC